MVSTATGGSLFFVSIANITAPVVFATLFAATGSYSASFAVLTVTSVAAIVCLLRALSLGRATPRTHAER
jgi:hypothetical protein